jgi:hypothetical protein
VTEAVQGLKLAVVKEMEEGLEFSEVIVVKKVEV